ncbi:Plasmodium exported protein (Pm-fam-a like), unknown function [Plasmodium ovale curtisi]|uniref:Uncharacterized protein n=1 Tax=Plasmodium ovale curtisi TaxID=864141 RepID=A0A1A8XBQ7_PLAOA|nr:Plasmodium exported protein (Pm-fam-a like), unknown function [Plasmodium ovale curtisi]SBT02634.1 Plasmodium exported protein (Pm-fam-a like), unknown function [Plasmodium ovale curtisi]
MSTFSKSLDGKNSYAPLYLTTNRLLAKDKRKNEKVTIGLNEKLSVIAESAQREEERTFIHIESNIPEHEEKYPAICKKQQKSKRKKRREKEFRNTGDCKSHKKYMCCMCAPCKIIDSYFEKKIFGLFSYIKNYGKYKAGYKKVVKCATLKKIVLGLIVSTLIVSIPIIIVFGIWYSWIGYILCSLSALMVIYSLVKVIIYATLVTHSQKRRI